MGKAQSKNSEVIIAQNGANDATNTSTLERKLEIYSIFTTLLFVIVVVILAFVGFKQCGRRAKKVLVKDIVSSLEKGQSQQPAGVARHIPAQPVQHSY